MIVALAVAVIAAQQGPASPSQSPARLAAVAVPGSPASATAQSSDDKVVCRREQETGSLLPAKKICRRQSEWDQMARDARDTTNAVTLMGNHCNGGGGG